MSFAKIIVVACALVAALGLAPAPASARGAPAPYSDWNPDYPGFPSNVERSERGDCLDGSDECIERTIGEMWRRFHRMIPTCDHNAIFSLTYLRVTEDVREAIDTGFYPDLGWINGQDASFARIYFLNYANWRAGRLDLVPESWRMTFGASERKEVEGIGNLLLSMNAHINRDFPFVVYHAGVTDTDGSSKKPEHDAYNARLRALYKPMLAELAERFDETIDDYDVPGLVADDEAFFQLLVQWRETTWQNAVRLAEAENDAERRQVARSIEAYANAQAQLIYAGSVYGPGEDASTREARCAANGGQRESWKRGAEVAEPTGGNLAGADRVRALIRCPDGVGPCRGTLKVRQPRTMKLLGRAPFNIAAGKTGAIKVGVGQWDSLQRERDRGFWVATRSKLSPAYSVTDRVKARLQAR